MVLAVMSSVKENTAAASRKANTLAVKWKWAIGVMFIVLTGEAVAGVALDALTTTDAPNLPESSEAVTKEFHLSFYEADRNTVTMETVYVNKREEQYVLENGAVAIFDFNTGFVTYQLNKDVRNCYMTNFDLSKMLTPQQLETMSTDGEASFDVDGHVDKRYRATDIWVNKAVLGSMARSVCEGMGLYMLQDVTGTDKATSVTSRKRRGLSYWRRGNEIQRRQSSYGSPWRRKFSSNWDYNSQNGYTANVEGRLEREFGSESAGYRGSVSVYGNYGYNTYGGHRTGVGARLEVEF